MKISILCTDESHPVQSWLNKWVLLQCAEHEVELCLASNMLSGGDILFLVSCHEFISAEIRHRYNYALLLHASNLPEGRGWAPHIWQILDGKKEIVVSLLEVEDRIDSGKIWKKERFHLEGHELYNEINEKLFTLELELMSYALANHENIQPICQDDSQATYYQRRTPVDSRIESDKTIEEQFDILRVADPDRFPAYIILRGYKYKIILEKINSVEEK